MKFITRVIILFIFLVTSACIGLSFVKLKSRPVVQRDVCMTNGDLIWRKFLKGTVLGSTLSFGQILYPICALGYSEATVQSSQRPKGRIVIEDEEVRRIFTKARQCENDGDFVEAQNLFQQVLTVSPDYILAWSDLGNVLTARGNVQQALLCYKKALILQPPMEVTSIILLNKAAVELSLGSNEDAIRDLDLASKISGPTPAIVTNKAVALSNNGDWIAACEMFEKVISTAERDAFPWWLRYSMALLETNRGAESVAFLQRTLNRYPLEGECNAFAAALYTSLGTKNEATRYWLKVSPEERAQYTTAGFVKEKLHWGPKAIKNMDVFLEYADSKGLQ